MKSVLISIQPQWCELIASGKKQLEIRKTRPKLETPFKCYIYQTKKKWWYKLLEPFKSFARAQTIMAGQRKVIGEFTCNQILSIGRRGVNNNFDYCYESLNIFGNDDIEPYITAIRKSCLGKNVLHEYAKDNPYLYGWYISDLKIYDAPKKISEFRKACGTQNCDICQFWENTGEYAGCLTSEERRLRRPPESWCYVEEV